MILSTASQRDDGAVLPLPETLKLSGGALTKVLGSLKAKGLIEHRGTPRGDEPPPLRITRSGLRAIGVEPEDDASGGATPADTGPTPADSGVRAIDAAAPVIEADGAATPPKAGKAGKRKASATKAGSADKPTPRAGTNSARRANEPAEPRAGDKPYCRVDACLEGEPLCRPPTQLLGDRQNRSKILHATHTKIRVVYKSLIRQKRMFDPGSSPSAKTLWGDTLSAR